VNSSLDASLSYPEVVALPPCVRSLLRSPSHDCYRRASLRTERRREAPSP
jgi:hypothetical protein